MMVLDDRRKELDVDLMMGVLKVLVEAVAEVDQEERRVEPEVKHSS